jgi:hypothetical protein
MHTDVQIQILSVFICALSVAKTAFSASWEESSGTQALASMILSRKRRISLNNAKQLAKHFREWGAFV